MNKSESITALAVALRDFQYTVPHIAKTSVNPFFNSKYAELSYIVRVINATMLKCGLAVSQLPATTSEGLPALETILLHESGEWISNTTPLVLKKNKKGELTPESHGGSITYVRRYALCAILGIVADEDDDGNFVERKQDKPGKKETKIESKEVESAEDVAIFEKYKAMLEQSQSLPQIDKVGLTIHGDKQVTQSTREKLKQVYYKRKFEISQGGEETQGNVA